MTSRDFIRSEAENTDRIILYREGLFWKAYERSAFAVCTQIRPFKPTKKRLKVLDGGEIVSIGFPSASENRVLDGFERLETEPCKLVVATERPIDAKEFEAWKSSIATSRPRPERDRAEACGRDEGKTAPVPTFPTADEVVADENEAPAAEPSADGDPLDGLPAAVRYGEADFTLTQACELAARVKGFNLADSTPLECIFFISELKKLLRNR